MWPYEFKFVLTKPVLIYKSIIKTDGSINTLVFPTMNNTYEDKLKPLVDYARATTITIDSLQKVIRRLMGSSATGYSKKELLNLLEKFRVQNGITNADLCDTFAEEIYLPLIIPKKSDIPPEIKSKFPELA